jgi:D-3-phosphoglycerate dehydrogenase
MATENIIVTGPPLAAAAIRLLEENQLRPVTLAGPPSTEAIISALLQNQAVGLIVRGGSIDRAVLESGNGLRVVAKHGSGIDNIDLDAANQCRIPVFVSYGANAVSVAEHALTLMLCQSKQITSLDQRLRDGLWDKGTYKGIELTGKSVGLIGFGQIAQTLARFLLAFDMEVVACVREVPQDHGFGDRVRFTLELADALSDMDFVSIHCPLTPQTRGLIGRQQFDLMKETAIIINTARGEIIQEEELIHALRAGRIAGAGLDCFASEPVSEDNPLLEFSNVLVTPHIAWATKDSIERMSCMAARNVVSILKGLPIDMNCLVNPEALAC